MKKLFITVFLMGSFMMSQAQIKTPAPSPSSKVMQTVGLTDVEPVSTAETTESFTISVDDLKSDEATINLTWENTRVPLTLKVHTDKQAMASIDKVIAGPSKGEYYSIASYYHSSGKDLDKALEYINIATEGDNKKFWQVRRKALILGDMGKTKEAIAAAKLSLELATKAGNKDYIRMNEQSIAEWSK